MFCDSKWRQQHSTLLLLKESQQAEIIDETVLEEVKDEEFAGSGVDTDTSNDV